MYVSKAVKHFFNCINPTNNYINHGFNTDVCVDSFVGVASRHHPTNVLML